MAKWKDISGQTFGKLTAIRFSHRRNRMTFWIFSCSCGIEKEIFANNVITGKTNSCGCLFKELPHPLTTHGKYHTPEHRTWTGILTRCRNKNEKSFSRYGGRGITVCERWINSFENFYADMGQKPSQKHSIDRINVNGNYEPGNCRWATEKEQANNKRLRPLRPTKGVLKTSKNRWQVVCNGKTIYVKTESEALEIRRKAVLDRNNEILISQAQ